MIPSIIRWSIGNRFLVLLLTVMLTAWGLWSVKQTPVDALPDLSDVQVIIKTAYPGQAPQVVEDQVTYPLTTAMLAVPGATTVRGYSFFGDSFVYVLFDDNTDLYWARARVLEYLSQVAPNLPASARPQLGPDATGVGWVYQYALVDRTGKHDLSELTSLQNWFLKYELQTVEGLRSRHRGRHGASVSGAGRPGQAARLRHPALPDRDRHQAGQSGDRRLRHRDGRSGVHGALQRLPQERGGSEADPARHHCARRPAAAGRRGGCGHRAPEPARSGRAQR